MGDSGSPDLDGLMTCTIPDLIDAILPMSANECERHARAILRRVGGPTFEQYLMRITETMVPEGGGGPPSNPDEYYFAVRDFIPDECFFQHSFGNPVICMKMQGKPIRKLDVRHD